MSLDLVLAYCKPPEWEDVSYASHRYQLFELKQEDDEYCTEMISFREGYPRLQIQSLKRVQNPYQLGRFLIRKEQKKYRHDATNVMKFYHPINNVDTPIALEHNMDVRRYFYKYSGSGSKNPMFYNTPRGAFNAITEVCSSSKTILICNVLQDYSMACISKTNDTEYMPTYVASLE